MTNRLGAGPIPDVIGGSELAESHAASGAAQAADYAVCWLDLQGKVSRWSEASSRLFGHAAEVAVGLRFGDLLAPWEGETGRAEVALARAREAGSWDDVGWRPGPSGARFWAATSVTLVKTPNGVEIGYMVVTRDLTSLESHRPGEEPVDSTSRLVSAGRVAMQVAHEVGNILAAASGFAGLLERHLPTDGAAHQVWRELLRAHDRGTAITQRLLSVGRPTESTPRAVDLHELVGRLEPLLRQVLPDRIALRTDVEAGLPEVFGSESDIELAVLNLVVNARDAIAGTGTVSISGSLSRLPGQEERCEVVLTVRDSGPGIPSAVRERIFERFFTTKEAGHGAGLGLALVRDAVRQCGGTIEVDSSPEEGTSMRIRLRPVHAAAAGSEAGAGAPSDRGVGGLALVYAARPTLRARVTALLEDQGFAVLEAETSLEASGIVERHGETIGLALVDADLPESDRAALVNCLGDRASGALAILFDEDARERTPPTNALQAPEGVSGPVGPSELLEEIDQLLVDPGLRGGGAIH